MEKLKAFWQNFADKHPKAEEWVREGGLFFLVSNLITIIRGLLIEVLELAFAFLGDAAIGFPRITLNILGIEFPWYIIGASHEQGGVAYFTALMCSMWVCEIINFFMQRKFVFRSNGKVGRQAALYFLVFCIVTCIVNAVSNLWDGLASHFLPSIICSLGTTFLTGGVAMIVYFFANKRIFKDSTAPSSTDK
jgi:putative flippase GtrA